MIFLEIQGFLRTLRSSEIFENLHPESEQTLEEMKSIRLASSWPVEIIGEMKSMDPAICDSADLKNKHICPEGSYGLFLTYG